ncbi:MAG: peptidase M75 [Bacteroidales bacterium]|nr:peptidase M75 [Bacteroidales bacterium]
MKKTLFLVLSIAMWGFVTSCERDEANDINDAAMLAVAEQYVDHVVAPTYESLAEASERLVEDLRRLQISRTDANVQTACATFLEARAWWEKSEAFLYGAASDFGIDPHIDSWPLDEDGFNTLMSNTAQINAMSGEDGDEYAGSYLGNSLLGFHGIEYILFEDGHAKSAAHISDLQMIYAVAVAGDLRNSCFQLEVSWMGDKAPTSHRDKVEALELNTTINGGNSYGDNFVMAGKAGSTYSSRTGAMMAILDGCATIADEVGTSKIGKPYNGEDPHYIESPYSQKSIVDFHDNIISIQNAYMGGVDGQRNSSRSLHALMSEIDADVDARITSAIENALSKIDRMKAPFVLNYTDPSCLEAINACLQLDEALSMGITSLRNN